MPYIARTIIGIGIGTDLAIVNTYISEVAPLGTRGTFISLNFVVGSVIGSLPGIWLALYLTTPAAPGKGDFIDAALDAGYGCASKDRAGAFRA